MSKEIRAFNFEVRAEQNDEHGHYLSGRPIVYDARTDLGAWDEIIEKGALDEADLKDVRFLVNHNTDMIPLARSRNNNENSTMQMSVDDDGMTIRVDLDTENNAEAKSLYSAVERGDLDGMSFMFTVDADKWEDIESDHPTRSILKLGRIFEVSAVTFPAYEQTSITARGLSDALESAKESLENERAAKRAIEAQKQKIRIMKGV
jgi:HK97 family phage prohead protease